MTPTQELIWAAKKFRQSWDEVGLSHDATMRYLNDIRLIAAEFGDDGKELVLEQEGLKQSDDSSKMGETKGISQCQTL